VLACGKKFRRHARAPCARRKSIGSLCGIRLTPDGRHILDPDASVEGDRRKGEACCLTGEEQRKMSFFDWAMGDGKRHHTLQ
jgi:hypothetical protein